MAAPLKSVNVSKTYVLPMPKPERVLGASTSQKVEDVVKPILGRPSSASTVGVPTSNRFQDQPKQDFSEWIPVGREVPGRREEVDIGIWPTPAEALLRSKGNESAEDSSWLLVSIPRETEAEAQRTYANILEDSDWVNVK